MPVPSPLRSFKGALLVGALLVGLGFEPALADPHITRVSFAHRSDGLGYVVRIEADERIRAYSLDEDGPERIRVRLYQTELGSDWERGRLPRAIRDFSLEEDGAHAWLTMDLDPTLGVRARAYPDRDSDDLLIALTITPNRPPIVAGGRSPGGTGPVPTGTGSAWELDCVVLDAGHGGHDGGTNHGRALEKDIALAVTLRLGELVQSELGMRVVYTRQDDRFVELNERGRIANESCGKLFVSIHANAAGNSSAHGTETYFLGRGSRMPHSRQAQARSVMERENAVIDLESDPQLYAGFTEGDDIMQELVMSAYQQESEMLASLVEEEFGRAHRQSRGVKQDGFVVLWAASMPAVLVELGFVTNPEERRLLTSASGQEAQAQALLRALRRYRAQYQRSIAQGG